MAADPVFAGMAAGAAVTDTALKIYDDKLSNPLAIAWAWLAGKELLIVGPSGAGKTRFLNYIKHAQLSPATPHDKTTKPTINTARKITFGTNFVFRVKATMDSVGQDAPADQAERVRRENPHELVIVVDVTATGKNECTAWVELFLDKINPSLKNQDHLKRLENITILINKIDQSTDEKVEATKNSLATLLKTKLSALSEDQQSSIAVQPTVLVNTDKYGEKPAHDALKSIAYKSENAHSVPLRNR